MRADDSGAENHFSISLDHEMMKRNRRQNGDTSVITKLTVRIVYWVGKTVRNISDFGLTWKRVNIFNSGYWLKGRSRFGIR